MSEGGSEADAADGGGGGAEPVFDFEGPSEETTGDDGGFLESDTGGTPNGTEFHWRWSARAAIAGILLFGATAVVWLGEWLGTLYVQVGIGVGTVTLTVAVYLFIEAYRGYLDRIRRDILDALEATEPAEPGVPLPQTGDLIDELERQQAIAETLLEELPEQRDDMETLIDSLETQREAVREFSRERQEIYESLEEQL